MDFYILLLKILLEIVIRIKKAIPIQGLLAYLPQKSLITKYI